MRVKGLSITENCSFCERKRKEKILAPQPFIKVQILKSCPHFIAQNLPWFHGRLPCFGCLASKHTSYFWDIYSPHFLAGFANQMFPPGPLTQEWRTRSSEEHRVQLWKIHSSHAGCIESLWCQQTSERSVLSGFLGALTTSWVGFPSPHVTSVHFGMWC